MTATIEKAFNLRVAVAADNTALIAFDCADENKVVLECPERIAQQLTMSLITAGFGPNKVARA